MTDRQFYHDYKRVVKRSKGEISKKDCRSYEKDESNIFFNKNWEASNLVVNFNYYKNLVDRDPQTLQRLPQLTYSTMRRPLC